MKYYNHIYKVFLMQIQLARNHGPLKPCALNSLHPYSFPSQSYREKQVISFKHLDKCLKSRFDGKMFFKFQ